MNFRSWWRWLFLAAIVFAVLLIPIPASSSTPGNHVFRIEASRFAYSPAVLQVNPGDQVTIELVATDVVHGLSIDGYNLQTTADPGQTASLTFVANQEGTFRFHCTVTCGNLHPFMSGKLEVGRNLFFWRALALLALAILGGVWSRRK